MFVYFCINDYSILYTELYLADLFLLCQEQEEELLRKAEEEDAASSSSESSESSHSSGSSSAVGLHKGAKAAGKPKQKAKAKPQQCKKQTPEASAAPTGQETSVAGSLKGGAAKSEKSTGDAKISTSALLEKSKAALKSLEEVSAWHIWSGSLKGKDIESRLSKGLDLVSKCEARSGDASLASTTDALSKEANRVSQQVDLLQGISSAAQDEDFLEHITRNPEEISQIVVDWGNQELSSFLNDVGRRLSDMLVTSEAKVLNFFDYIHLRTSEKDINGFSLSFLKSFAEKMEQQATLDELTGTLLQAQQTLLNYFLDRFRSMGNTTTETILQSIPKSWFLPEICRRDVFAHKVLFLVKATIVVISVQLNCHALNVL